MNKHLLFVEILVIAFLNANAQKQDYIWRVGDIGIVNFNSGVADTSSISQITRPVRLDWTNAAICDSLGKFQFFTNGINIYNLNNDTLFNGKNLNPSPFTSNHWGGLVLSGADIIIQRPEHTDQYYLFHQTIDNDTFPNDFCNVLYQTVLDMTLDGGKGGVTTKKNYRLYENDTIIGGNLAAVRHANGRDWWMLSKKLLKPWFYKWLITPDTILGPFIQTDQLGETTAQGQLALGQAFFSPQGDKYSVIYSNKHFYIYDFDRCSGSLTYLYDELFNDSAYYGTGCVFSSSGQYVYACTQYFIYQFDATSGNIPASKKIVAVYDGFVDPPPIQNRFNQMKLAPDKKIYIAMDNGSSRYLSVIEYPDSLGDSCDVQQHSFKIPGIAALSLPNIPDYRLGALKGSDCDTLTGIDEYLTKGKKHNIKAYPNPTKGTVTIEFRSMESGNLLLEVYDIAGRSLMRRDEKAKEGLNFVDLDLEVLSGGIYFLNLISHDRNEMIRIIIE